MHESTEISQVTDASEPTNIEPAPPATPASRASDVDASGASDGDARAASDVHASAASDVQASQASDVHRSKISPDDPRLRLGRSPGRTLRRGPVLAALVTVAGLVAVALVAALGGFSNDLGKNVKAAEVAPPTRAALPDVIKDAPVAPVASPDATSGPKLVRRAVSPPDAGVGSPPASGALALEQQARREALLRARGAGVFAPAEGAINAGPPVASDLVRRSDDSREAGPRNPAAHAAPDQSRPGDPNSNLQDHKTSFLAGEGSSDSSYLEKTVTPPRSPYEVKAGTVIPAVLLSGINSDLPGKIVAQVRENVYDTVAGNHLLIPQGSRLVATYDAMVAWGEERVLVCWNRLIRPDGSSLALECMPGVDLAGYAGFADDVDNHWGKLIGGVVFSSVLAATAQRSQGDVTGFQPTYPQLWASNAAGQINQSGQQLTQRNLRIPPTITVRPGFSVNVLVTKDIVIEPYSEGGERHEQR